MVWLLNPGGGSWASFGGSFVVKNAATTAAIEACCCDDDPDADCCLPNLSTTLCATLVTSGAECPAPATTTADLAEVYTNAAGTFRVWQGVIDYGGSDWHIQVGAECGSGGDVQWYLCHDSCFGAASMCNVDPPDLTNPDWTSLDNVLGSSPDCIFGDHIGVPISSCADCEFVLTVVDGAC